jgi:muramoyltetrapeptide carboxypeptidase
MITPKRLRKGSRIGFVSPSNRLRSEKVSFVERGIGKLDELGYEVVWGEHARGADRFGVSSGTAEERVGDIHRFFEDDSIDAIWCVHGGNSANELLDRLDYDLIRTHPKLLIGLSDNSVLLNAVTKCSGLITMHGADPKIGSGYFDDEYTYRELVERLERGTIGEIPPSGPRETVRRGKAEGTLVGGNLTCLLKTAGTEYFPETDGSIFLLEDLDTEINGVFARLSQLRQMGVFDRIAGMIVGDIYPFDRGEGQIDASGNRVSFEELLLLASQGYDFPILKIREVGHRCPSTFLPVGGRVRMDADRKSYGISDPYLI